jgi:hydroxyethylthiazole kinase-like uncharacterized protein yjeF
MNQEARASLPPARPVWRVDAIRRIEQRFLPAADPPLMERAGAAAAAIAGRLLQRRAGPVLVAAGPGNNGGDAFVVARLLRAAGHTVACAFAGDPQRLPADARGALQAWQDAGGTTVGNLASALEIGPALAVDGLFGIGLTRDIAAPHAAWIERLNALDCPLLALDIPSGLDADTGKPRGIAIRASHTATFIGLKPGLLTGAGPQHCGQVQVCDLDLAADHGVTADGWTLTPATFAQWLRRRPLDSHKGSFGDAGIVGGAPGMVGAALLAGRAALRLGAGRVFVGMLAADAPAVDPARPELMLQPPRAVVDRASALALGPGLGQGETALGLLEQAIARPVPLVLDADALNLLARHPVLAHHAARRTAATLITPHPAEAGRLLGETTAAVQADRIAAACELARRLGCFAVLKGSGSVVAGPDGQWWINASGNPGMASAGMGDVLTGMAAALLAQGWEACAALRAAVHLHGAAADILADGGDGPIGLAAGELIVPARRLLNGWIAAHCGPPDRLPPAAGA